MQSGINLQHNSKSRQQGTYLKVKYLPNNCELVGQNTISIGLQGKQVTLLLLSTLPCRIMLYIDTLTCLNDR